LYKYISLSEDCEKTRATVVEIDKDPAYGDILMVCTDGIYSIDHVMVGRDANGKVWISAETSMLLFLDALRAFFKADPENWSQSRLDGCLGEYMTKLKEQQGLEDDASLAVTRAQGLFPDRQRPLIERFGIGNNDHARTSKSQHG
jgi:hypothetical protein